MEAEIVRDAVRKTYGEIATGQINSGCCGSGSACCGVAPESAQGLGYSDEDLASVPEGANLGLGCGNPQAIAALRPGERVLDLGSGAGFDAFLAARQVGTQGSVIGVDMTAEMVAKARGNAAKIELPNVEFRLGEIERLPVADGSVDVIMSNCVINLSPDKPAVFREAFRVLAPGGRLAISDIVALAPLPVALANDLATYTGCVAGAGLVSDLERMLAEAGFCDVGIDVKTESRALVSEWMPGRRAEDYVASALIQAIKPGPHQACCDSTLLSTCCPPEKKEAAAAKWRFQVPAGAVQRTPPRSARIMTEMTSDTGELWEQLHSSIRGFVSRRVRNSADVDDVVQRVFLQVHRGLPSLRDEDRVHAWVYRTAQHAIVDYYRSPISRREIPGGSLADFVDAPQSGSDQGEEDDRAAEQEFAGCVQPLLRTLPAADIEALTLIDLQGMSQIAAAGQLSLSVSGMKSRVQRARRRFKAVVEDCCRVHLDRRGGVTSYEPRRPSGCGCDQTAAPAEGAGCKPTTPPASVRRRPT